MKRIAAAALLLLAATAQAAPRKELQPLAWLAGSCWTGTFTGSANTDTHCFEWVYDGQFLRDRHVVRDSAGKSLYEGETTYAWDADRKVITWSYLNVLGGLMSGTAEPSATQIVFPEKERQSVWTRGENSYVAAVSEKGKEVRRMTLTRDGSAPKKLADAYDEVAKLFDAYVEKSHMPGAAMGIIVDGKLVWTRTAGLQSLGGAPFAIDTRSRIASMTKSFTAASILQLRDAKKLALDDPVAKYIPELAKIPYPTADSPVLTIRHLLTHSEGFPEDNPWGDRQLGRANETMSAWMKSGIPFSTTPGTAYEYSNYGFSILGQIVERVSGQPYDVYVRKNLLDPLGMRDTTLHMSEVPDAKKALGYRWQDEQWVAEPILAHGAFGAMGGLWTTIPDLAKWVTFLMSAYPARDGAETGPLKRSSAREMQELARMAGASARRSATDAPLNLNATGYGYGLGVTADCRFRHLVAHGGGLPGYGSLMSWLPDYGVGLVFVSNRTYGSAGALFSDVYNALKKTGALQPRAIVPAPALLAMQSEATKLLTRWDDAAAERVVADNFLLDKSAARWKKESEELGAAHGTCTMGAIEPLNALRGRWRLNCERGRIDVFMTLAPTMPPRIQALNATSVADPDAVLRARVASALKPAGDVFTSDFDRAKLDRQLAALASNWGACTVGEPLRGDGSLRAGLTLTCEKGTAAIDVELDAESKKIKTVDIVPGTIEPCVP